MIVLPNKPVQTVNVSIPVRSQLLVSEVKLALLTTTNQNVKQVSVPTMISEVLWCEFRVTSRECEIMGLRNHSDDLPKEIIIV